MKQQSRQLRGHIARDLRNTATPFDKEGYSLLKFHGIYQGYTSDIGIVGRMPGFYALFVGGDFEGTRLNQPLAEKVPLHGIAEVLDPLFALYASARAEGKGFGDFCHRAGMPALQIALAKSQKGAA